MPRYLSPSRFQFSPPPARHRHSGFAGTSDLSIWLSVDPMADKYPSTSPYTYCGNNPVKLVDADGREIVVPDDPTKKKSQNTQTTTIGASNTYYGVYINASASTSKTNGEQKLCNTDKKIMVEESTRERTTSTVYQFGKPLFNAYAEGGASTSASFSGQVGTTFIGIQTGVGVTRAKEFNDSQISVSVGVSNGKSSYNATVSIKPLRVIATAAAVVVTFVSVAVLHVPIAP